ncbi:MAG: hypothetical protein RMK89_09385 [Armatimonadota bacterium]|nr:hypothetical protein [Armatimonadota bacterium]MDW8143659.1 hypothetical protein [Armatimonadota bacterium]
MRFGTKALLVIGFAVGFVLLCAVWFILTFPSRELKKETDWLKANKLPTKIGELLPQVPNSQNAAPLYRKAFEAMNLSKDEASWLGNQIRRKQILSGQVDWEKLKEPVKRNWAMREGEEKMKVC